ncbi:MAG TPA: sigma-70 family RNA polymerase sigma factor [Rudaea sp.]|nr:sigma-70 family RNA polymerase sigma factor [Rudaea sp.]
MTEDPDADLVLRCRNGDRRAFDDLLGRHARQVFAAAYRILHDREDAFDVTQSAFLSAYEHLDRYDPGQPFRTWLYRIAVNQALDLIRARRPAEALADETVDDHQGPDELAARDANDVALQGALTRLNVDYRTVIVLKHLQGCSYDEMALILECPVKTVKSRLFTARQALRAILVAKGWL